MLKTYGENLLSQVPSKTFAINGNHIGGYIDGLQAFKQAVDLILSTERYSEIIFSWDYGTEFADLIGERRNIVVADIERRIDEALKQDDRYINIDNFSIEFEGEQANIKFTVSSRFGNLDIERSVAVGR